MLKLMKLPKIYDPGRHEADIYSLWEKSGAFQPKHSGAGSFGMVFPLPNANGDLHIGHALTNALHDILSRYHRMKGESVLYLPGADHAGFETWVVYEKKLSEQGKSRFDFTREQLYRQVWDFVALNKTNLESQFRALGASCDWSRFTFTLDERIVRQAYATFKKMWDEGLIYRGERLVNFCTFHGTAFADIEVKYKKERGNLWFICYPLVDKSGEIVIATTRPETMLGDVALAVNPNDNRYKNLVGKSVNLPLTEREIPIIADDFVDKEFGTGAVKITPAHDPNDFEVGQRHDLPMISVIDHEGKMIDVPEPYRGLDVKEARKKVIKNLEEQGFLVKSESHGHSVGHCYKCGSVIQPLLREQWFIDMQPLAQKAIKELESGSIIFYPEAKKAQLITYLKNLKDWNISRQIAWGIPIPAFQNVDEPDDWIYDERVDQEILEIKGKNYRRDSDVFDTWFSSSSWPYATLGFPNSQDFKKFYPLSIMETGSDILMPWVSRMIMFGLYTTGKIPFKKVYLHGLIFDEHGQKMSKSRGNVINPMEVIDAYGSDALRMGLIATRVPAVNRGYDPRRVEDARNFCNKLWNITRYIEDKADVKKMAEGTSPKTIADHWLLSKLQQITGAVSADLESYRFADAYDSLYHFVWDDFADWYIEASKVQPNPGMLALALEAILKLTHPFAPFVTEAIWQTLAWKPNSLLMAADWPQAFELSAEQGIEAEKFEELRDVVEEVRFIKSALNNRKNLIITVEKTSLLNANAGLLTKLAGIETINVGRVDSQRSILIASAETPAWLDVGPTAKKQFIDQLKDRISEQENRVKQFQKRLDNKSYVANAPKELVSETKAHLKEAGLTLKKFTEDYERFAR